MSHSLLPASCSSAIRPMVSWSSGMDAIEPVALECVSGESENDTGELVRAEGLEPSTYGLKSRCSAN